MPKRALKSLAQLDTMQQAGNETKAKQYYSRLVKIAGKGDPRPELQAARKYLNGGV